MRFRSVLPRLFSARQRQVIEVRHGFILCTEVQDVQYLFLIFLHAQTTWRNPRSFLFTAGGGEQTYRDRGQCLRQRKTGPQTFRAEKDRQQRNQNRRPDDAPGKGNRKRLSGAPDRLPVRNHQDVDARKEKSPEIGGAPLHREVYQLGIPRIEQGEKPARKKRNHDAAENTEDKEHPDGKPEQPSAPLTFTRTKKITEYRLKPLRHSEEQRQDNQHQVADDKIGGKSDFTEAVAHNRKIVHEGDDADAELHDKIGKAEPVHRSGILQLQFKFRRIQRFPFEHKMGQKNEHAENRTDCGGERGPGNPHVHRIHENIIENDVRHGTDHERGHREFRPIVVPHQSAQEETEKQERRERDDVTHIDDRLPMNLRNRTEQPRKPVKEHIPEDAYRKAGDGGAQDREGTDTARRLLFAPAVHGRNHDARTGGDRHGQRDEYFHQRNRNRGGGHRVTAEPVADENPIDYHVDRIEQQPRHLRKRIPREQNRRTPFVHSDLLENRIPEKALSF